MAHCFKCGGEVVVIERRVGRRDECEHCGADLHCCFNCEFYDRSRHNECREPISDRVKDKDRANFCDFFKIKEQRATAPVVDKAAEAKRKLEEMFKKKG